MPCTESVSERQSPCQHQVYISHRFLSPFLGASVGVQQYLSRRLSGFPSGSSQLFKSSLLSCFVIKIDLSRPLRCNEECYPSSQRTTSSIEKQEGKEEMNTPAQWRAKLCISLFHKGNYAVLLSHLKFECCKSLSIKIIYKNHWCWEKEWTLKRSPVHQEADKI